MATENKKTHPVILIVENSITSSVLMSRILVSDCGILTHNIYLEKNGMNALNKIKEGLTPDLILMDHYMPVMNGYHTVKKIRELKIHTPIILISSESETSTLLNYFSLGNMDYHMKPISRKRFVIKIKNHLGLLQTPAVS